MDFREDPVTLKTQVLCNTHIDFEKRKHLKIEKTIENNTLFHMVSLS